MARIGALVRMVWAMALGVVASQALHAQPARDDAQHGFRLCDDRAFLALNMARNYLMTGRNKELVSPIVKGSLVGEAMAEELFRRVEANEIRHPGQFAADVLIRCASDENIKVGAARPLLATCFVRTDVAFFMHASRVDNLPQIDAMTKVSGRLKARDLYPMWLISDVNDAVYRPAQTPDLRQLMGAVAWGCVRQRGAAPVAAAASAASR